MAAARSSTRKPRSDKGLVREVTRLKNLSKKVLDILEFANNRPEGLDTRARMDVRTATQNATAVHAGLKKLDGRMKVRFDPSQAGK